MADKDKTNPYFDIDKTLGSMTNLREQLDNISRESGFGALTSSAWQNLYGINYLRHGQPLVPSNRDNMGYVFFTRPILNLSYDNLSTSSTMHRLRDASPYSIEGYVRTILDPWQAKPEIADYNYRDRSGNNIPDFKSPLADPSNPFIPILTNNIISLSGWKDITLNSYTSKAGINNEQWSMVDGYYYKNEAYEMTASFRNISGDPISYLFQTWLEYMGCCGYRWQMSPYPCFIEEREWDYNTCIYRFIMDETRTYIRKWATTIASPLSVPYGGQFNYASDKNYTDSNDEITISFQCNGAQYNDPITFYNFNKIVGLYETGLRINYGEYNQKENSLVVYGSSSWRKLKRDEKAKGVGLALPLINHITHELEWWIRSDDYNNFVKNERMGKWYKWETEQLKPTTDNTTLIGKRLLKEDQKEIPAKEHIPSIQSDARYTIVKPEKEVIAEPDPLDDVLSDEDFY